MTLSILIRGSKNDQEKLGVTRVIRANQSDLCPVQEAFAFLTHRQSVAGSSKWPPSVFRGRLTDAIKWAAIANNIPTDVVSTHSLRAGGGAYGPLRRRSRLDHNPAVWPLEKFNLSRVYME